MSYGDGLKYAILWRALVGGHRPRDRATRHEYRVNTELLWLNKTESVVGPYRQ
jgi:hypothetical protein